MRVLVAGASGAIGRPLTRLLVARGHTVIGLIRDRAGAASLRDHGSEGTTNLLTVARCLGARRIVTQSIILGYGYRDHGDRILTEDDPFGVPAGDLTDDAVTAMKSDEVQTFTAPEGIALRYGFLYGGDGVEMRALLAKRGVPVSAGGLLGWVHHHDAVVATVAALERGRPNQAYNIPCSRRRGRGSLCYER